MFVFFFFLSFFLSFCASETHARITTMALNGGYFALNRSVGDPFSLLLRLDRTWSVFARATNRDVSHSPAFSRGNPISTQIRLSRFLQDSCGPEFCKSLIPALMHYRIDRGSGNMKNVQSQKPLLDISRLSCWFDLSNRSSDPNRGHIVMIDQQFRRV